VDTSHLEDQGVLERLVARVPEWQRLTRTHAIDTYGERARRMSRATLESVESLASTG